ncbi:MAG TPA: hypothetical protein QF564_15960 [Pirellulaceae bacterium]|nr:hypothetical protein [Pirellulaceae bacterium]
MTQLARTRNQVVALQRHRLLMRWGTALAPLATGLLLILAAFWVVDFFFQLDAAQRTVMLVVCGLSLLWVFLRYALPLLSQHESTIDVALLVEQQHRLDSDLVAALQFDASSAVNYGSPELETAVVEQVSELASRIDFFEGTSYEQFSRRALMLAIIVILAVASIVVFPDHVRVFFQRLLLSADHYPTQTVMDTVVVNGKVVLSRAQHPTQPVDCSAAQGQPVTLFVQCINASQMWNSTSPLSGELRITGVDGGKKTVPLELLPLTDRLAGLEEAAIRIQEAIADPSFLVDQWWLDEVAPTVAFDAPLARTKLQRAREDRAALDAALLEIHRAKESWPGPSADFTLFHGQFERLIESIDYQVHIGDAWTDSARIQMISLPVVTLDLKVVPPKYAGSENSRKPTGSRQLSVLEGSAINMSLSVANEKQIEVAWVRVSSKSDTTRWDLVTREDRRMVWSLAGTTPFSNVTEEFSFELHVRDTDGLQPESPIRGFVRLRSDRSPTATMELVHRVVLPSARPVVGFRVTDDFGIARSLLHLSVQRQHNEVLAADSPPEPTSADLRTQEIPLEAAWLPADKLPYHGRYEVNMAALELSKGDQVKLTIEAVDYRGETPGKSTLSEAVVLDISDEAGVLAAIAEADENSEERLTEVIKEQLGIGDEK